MHVTVSQFPVHSCHQKASWKVKVLKGITFEAKTLFLPKICFRNEDDECIPRQILATRFETTKGSYKNAKILQTEIKDSNE